MLRAVALAFGVEQGLTVALHPAYHAVQEASQMTEGGDGSRDRARRGGFFGSRPFSQINAVRNGWSVSLQVSPNTTDPRSGTWGQPLAVEVR